SKPAVEINSCCRWKSPQSLQSCVTFSSNVAPAAASAESSTLPSSGGSQKCANAALSAASSLSVNPATSWALCTSVLVWVSWSWRPSRCWCGLSLDGGSPRSSFGPPFYFCLSPLLTLSSPACCGSTWTKRLTPSLCASPRECPRTCLASPRSTRLGQCRTGCKKAQN